MLSSQNTNNPASTGTKPTRDSGRRPNQRRERKPEPVVPWNPRTRLGSMVQAGSVQSMDAIFQNGWKIKEYEIVNKLIPDIQSFVVDVGVVQKQTDAGESTRFKSLVAVGNENGWFGVGTGKKPQMRNAIDSATQNAYLMLFLLNSAVEVGNADVILHILFHIELLVKLVVLKLNLFLDLKVLDWLQVRLLEICLI